MNGQVNLKKTNILSKIGYDAGRFTPLPDNEI